MANRLSIPYQLLTLIHYGTFDWVEREMPLVVLPITATSRQLRCRPEALRSSLEYLRDAGLIAYSRWYSNSHFTVRVQPPIGMSVNVGEVADQVASRAENYPLREPTGTGQVVIV